MARDRNVVRDRTFLIFLALVCAVLLFNVGMPLTDGDTALYGNIARHMLHTGDWLTLHDPSMPIMDKPPLTIWMIAISYKLFGFSNVATRLWHSLMGVGVVLLTYAFSRLAYSKTVSTNSGLILLSSILMLYTSMVPQQDVPSLLIQMAAFYFLLRFILGRRLLHFYLIWPLVGLALMTRGISAALFPLGVMVVYLITLGRSPHTYFSRGWAGLGLHLALGCVVLLGVGTPWYFQQYGVWGRPFLDVFLGASRYMSTKRAGVFDYVPLLVLAFLPWTAFMVPSVRANLAHLKPEGDGRRAMVARFLLVWLILAFLFPHTIKWRVIRYLLPCLPPLAVMTSVFLTGVLEQRWESLQKWQISGLRLGAWASLLLMLPLLVLSILLVAHGISADIQPYLPMLIPFVTCLAAGVLCLFTGVMSKKPRAGLYGLFIFTIVSWVAMVGGYSPTLYGQMALLRQADSLLRPKQTLYVAVHDYSWFYGFYSRHSVTAIAGVSDLQSRQLPALVMMNKASLKEAEPSSVEVLRKTRTGDMLVRVLRISK